MINIKSVFQSTFERVDLYCIDIQLYEILSVDIPKGFELKVGSGGNEFEQQFYLHYKLRGEKYLDVLKSRLISKNYRWYVFVESASGKIAYSRWVCYKSFYSDRYRKQFKFSDNEAITLDSYTHPDFRRKGLHNAMNVVMLNHLKNEGKLNELYMIIIHNIFYIKKIVENYGYKKLNTKFIFHFSNIINALKKNIKR